MPLSSPSKTIDTLFSSRFLRHTIGSAIKLHPLTGHTVIKAGSAGNAIAYHRNSTGLRLLNGILVVFDLERIMRGNLFRFQLHCLVHHTIYK